MHVGKERELWRSLGELEKLRNRLEEKTMNQILLPDITHPP
jgi:hypothetical protein